MAKVVVVDDVQEIRTVLRLFLELEGHDVVEAEDGTKALATPLSHRDIVLLDIMMPGIDGFSVLDQFCSRGSECPLVIMVTARTSELDRQKAFGLGAVGFVTKPFDVDDVAREIDNVLPSSDAELMERRQHEIYLSRLLYQLERVSNSPPEAVS